MGIQAIYDIIFNNPYETRDDVMETLRLLLAFPRPFQVQGFNLIFYPGTTITDNALKDGFIAPKPVTEDFSTIESAANSPVSMMGKAKVSERFYVVNYSSTDKAYLNSVIALMSSPFVPLPVIRYFGESEGPLKRVLLTAFIQGLSKGYKTLRPLYRSLRSCYRFVRQGQK
jgi:hypothetical protein